jgi:hypothetical protein
MIWDEIALGEDPECFRRRRSQLLPLFEGGFDRRGRVE